MNVEDVMTRSVIAVAPTDPISKAIRLMLQNHISGLPVVDEAGRLEGIVTEGDFLRRAETGTERRRNRLLTFILGPGLQAAEYVATHGRKVSEVMTRELVTVQEGTPLAEIVNLMESHRVKRIPVMRDDRIVGIVTRANLLRALGSLYAEPEPQSATDRNIRDRLVAELRQRSWGQDHLLDVTVHNGVVELWGIILDERHRGAIIVAAENTPGVVQVKDHLTWVEPTTGTTFGPPDEKPTYPLAS